MRDGEDHLVGVPCLAGGGIDGTQFLAFGCRGAGWDDWVGWRFNLWDVECLPVASQVDGWILKKTKVFFAVSLWIGNSHEVSAQFADAHLDLFMGGFAKNTCEDGLRHLCLNAFGRNGIRRHFLGGTGSSAKGRHMVASMTMLMMPMRKTQEVSYQFWACAATYAMDTQLTMAMVSLTAGLFASLKQITIRGCVEKGCSLVL